MNYYPLLILGTIYLAPHVSKKLGQFLGGFYIVLSVVAFATESYHLVK